MILKKLALTDIRPYRGTSCIEFAQDPVKNVTLIHGVNGAGKTSLFQALNWVLYGAKAKPTGHMLNSSLLRDLKRGESARGSVTLDFEDDKEDFQLVRSAFAQRSNGGGVDERELSVNLSRINADGNSEREQFPDQLINSILPVAIRTFYFFDGDKIAEFTKPGKEKDRDITTAVHDVLRLELINRSASHLERISVALEKDLNAKGSPEVNRVYAELAASRQQVSHLAKQRSDIAQEVEAVRERLADVARQLMQVAEVAEQAKQREKLKGDVKHLKLALQAAFSDLLKEAISAFTLPIGARLSEALSFLDEKRKKKEIPGNYKDQFLRDLLEHQVCICERPLQQGSVEYVRIEELLKQTLPGSIQDNAVELAGQVRGLVKNRDHLRRALQVRHDQIRQMEILLDRHEKELESLGAEIEENTAERVKSLEDRRKLLEAEDRKLSRALDENDQAITATRKRVETLERDYEKETRKEADLVSLRRERNIAARSAAAFFDIKDSLVTELRRDMSSEATEIFKTFTWKKDHFDRVVIGDGYLLSLLDRHGDNVRDVNSMGETQLLSLAFMLSMTRVSDHSAPLVIDTPLARLDMTVRANLLRALPDLTRQLVLLVTDSEMDLTSREYIDARVGMQYIIRFRDGISTIEEGRFS